MANIIVVKRDVKQIFCKHCKHRHPVVKGETPEQKEERKRKNEEDTLIYRKVTENGKIIDESGEYPYYYEKVAFHRECLLDYLKRKYKKNLDKINQIFEDIEQSRERTIDKGIKKGILKKKEVSNAKTTRETRERLVNYFMGHYGASVLSKKVQTTIKDLDEGKSSTFNNVVISYDKLLDMFLFYEDTLMGIYMSKVKKGEAPPNASQRILYDISVVVLNIDEYDSRKQVRYIQQDQKTEEELLDVKKYIQPTKKKTDDTIDKEVKKAKSWAEKETSEYDNKGYDIMEELFKDLMDDDDEEGIFQ